MTRESLLEINLDPSPLARAVSRDPLPLLETPTGGGAAPLEWIRAALGFAERGNMKFVSWAVLALSLVLTASVWRYVHVNEARHAETQFDREASSLVRRIEGRLGYYDSVLTGVAAFSSGESDSGQEMTDDTWDQYVRTVGADRRYPGIRSLELAVRDRGSDAVVVQHVYPETDSNRSAIGFDINRPGVRRAETRALETGEAAISRSLPLVVAQNEPGFLMYVPVYDPGAMLITTERRQAALIGYVVGVFHAKDFIQATLAAAPPPLTFAIYDGDGLDPARRFYGESLVTPHATYKLSFGGRTWTLAISPAAGAAHGQSLENEVAIFGIVVGLILFAMTGALTHALEHRKQINAVLSRRNALRSALAEAGRYALVTDDVGSVIDKSLAVIAKAIRAEFTGVLEFDQEKKRLMRRHGFGWSGEYAMESEAMHVDSAAGAAILERRSTVVADWQTDKTFKSSAFLDRHGVRSSANVLILERDRPYGVLGVHSTRPNAFGEEELAFVESVANIIAEAVRRERAGEILHQAQKMEAVGQLTGGIAHDFNNLLTVVLGNMELALEDARTPVALKPALEMTVQAATRGADLTQKMLAFSRRQPLRPDTVELDRTIGDMEGLLRRALGEHIEIETHLPRGLWKTHVDRTQLETAILNLAVNARDAMPKGGRLVIEAENAELDDTFASTNEIPRVGSYVCLTIADTGEGMPPEVLAHVFEPFFTTKDVGKGSGLGLSMVYGFVRQSGGYVRIYSEVGQGTTIRIYLPRLDAEGESARIKDSKPTLVRGAETVLVVEDDPMVRQLAIAMIGKLGYEVIVATDGPSALAVLDGERPIDLLFSDIVMPGGLTGTELAAQAIARRPGLKVLLTSGYSAHTIGKPGEDGLAYPLISKPYRAADLAARIRAILDGDKPVRDVA